ncbi:hypothetical protein LX36DRAFT_85733 [Colletotrichum falcatum]|nr:hypothetical protein LX36DRAFT_85733 [Colletotrichum falcatum]
MCAWDSMLRCGRGETGPGERGGSEVVLAGRSVRLCLVCDPRRSVKRPRDRVLVGRSRAQKREAYGSGDASGAGQSLASSNQVLMNLVGHSLHVTSGDSKASPARPFGARGCLSRRPACVRSPPPNGILHGKASAFCPSPFSASFRRCFRIGGLPLFSSTTITRRGYTTH